MATESKDPKDTIYIDVDDEITGIIDKVTSSEKKIVALVLPKRTSVLQSIVNMRLLKHAAGKADKKLVLITSEAGLLPLAGAVGLHVAKTLQSKPEIPDKPTEAALSKAEEAEPEIDRAKSIGELASSQAVKDTPEETIDLDNSTDKETEPAPKKSRAKAAKLKVPNFDMFRKRLFLVGAGLLALVFLWILAFSMLPKAKITIKTDAQTQEADPSITLDTDAREVDAKNGIAPAKLKQVKHSDTQSAPATGEKDKGDKASGKLTVKNCEDSKSHTVGAGSKFKSSGGKVFLNDSTFTVPPGGISGGKCAPGTATVDVTAAEGGESYNIGPTSYTSPLLSGEFDISGSKMSGGTSKIVKVVSQEDVNNAKDKLADEADEAKDELKDALKQANLLPLEDTFTPSKPALKITPGVDQEGDTVNVSATTTYSMLGAEEKDLEKLIDASLKGDIDKDKQQVQDYGFDKAKFSITGKKGSQYTVSVQTTVTIGPKLDFDDIKRRVAGKKKGDIQQDLGNEPGVKDVQVNYSPFWVYKAPKKASKITIIIEASESTEEQNP